VIYVTPFRRGCVKKSGGLPVRLFRSGAKIMVLLSESERPVVVAAGVKSVPAEPRAKLATANCAEPQSPKIVAKRSVPKRAHMAALCQRRASDWEDAIRDGLDPDIARFIRDQVAAWRLLANNYVECRETAR
jgi:hypothetical protein